MMKRPAVVLFLVAILPGLVWFATRQGGVPDHGGAIPIRDTGHPVLLLVDTEGIEKSRPRNAAGRWYDLEWVNVLTQGYGGCDVADLRTAGGSLEGRQLVVVPRRSAAGLTPGQLDALESGIEDGLTVLVEAPDSTLCRRLGLELAAVERRPRLPWPQPVASGARPRLVLRPQPVEVAWTRFRYAPRAVNPEERPRVHLSLDGRPMGWTLTRGDGIWATLAVDFAELVARLRQGEDGVALLPGQDHAWVDAWIEGVCGAALTTIPVPRIAAAPPGRDGWMVLVTDVDSTTTVAAAGVEPGWSGGTGLPARTLFASGRLDPDWSMAPVYQGMSETFDPRRLDRWIRHNREGAGGPLALRFVDAPPPALPEIRDGMVEATGGEVTTWWRQRSRIAIQASAAGEDVEFRIGEVPQSAHGFGILVPVQWRDRSLEGWETDWGLAPGHRAQRFDRSYRVVPVGPDASGGVLRLRYR